MECKVTGCKKYTASLGHFLTLCNLHNDLFDTLWSSPILYYKLSNIFAVVESGINDRSLL